MIIVKSPNSKLREKSEPVTDFSTLDMFLIPQMIQGMDESGENGVKAIGISAIQVGATKQVFIMRDGLEDIIVCNPKIIKYGDATGPQLEGCLSFENELIWIERPLNIDVEYQEKTGKNIKRSFDGMMARVFQHELDHLHGVLMIDRGYCDIGIIKAYYNHDNDQVIDIAIELGNKDNFQAMYDKSIINKLEKVGDNYRLPIWKLKELMDRGIKFKYVELIDIVDGLRISEDNDC